jgi:hypothetical protein
MMSFVEGQAISPPMIPGLGTVDVNLFFDIQPPAAKKGKDFKATLELQDHLGNHYKLKRLRFRGQRV